MIGKHLYYYYYWNLKTLWTENSVEINNNSNGKYKEKKIHLLEKEYKKIRKVVV